MERVTGAAGDSELGRVTIRLLGPPSITVDGRPVAGPRGQKSWGLLGYLVLSPRPVSRQQLSRLLFDAADDPLGALRWSLAELRRALGDRVRVSGDPVALELGPDVSVDVRLLDGSPSDAALLTLGGELLEGVAGGAAFETWLLVERHRVAGAREALCRRAALRLLAGGRAGDAVAFAARAVEDHPFEEAAHALLVRCLAAAGDGARAREHVEVTTAMFREELGVDVSAALVEAAGATGASAIGASVSGRASALTQLDAGRAAIAAGAVDAGLDCLRRAVHEAGSSGDRQLHARCLGAFGGALVHAVRGADEEGAIALLQAIEIANDVGDRAIAAGAHRELGFVDVQAGRRRTADRWLATAEELADDDGELAAVLGVRGMSASDAADYPGALACLGRSIEHARRAGDARQEAWSLSILGRAHLLRGEDEAAERALARSLARVREQRWLAFLPWPQSLWGELELRRGVAPAAASTFEQSWTLAAQIGDPCWEGMAARGLALVAAERADLDGASTWIGEGRARCTRLSDRYQWVHAHVLDSAVALARRRGRDDEARAINDVLAELAARAEMRELLARSLAHRAELGEASALDAARRVAANIDNPALAAHLDGVAGRSANGGTS